MSIQENQIIGELVAQDYRMASVFKQYGIDFCCQGNRTIREACEKKQVDAKTIVDDLENIPESQDNNKIDYKSWPLDLLADYIEKKHHRYVETRIPEIKAYLDKICAVHGDRHPELFDINALFADSAGELTAHMKKEEFILFPFIRKMVKIKHDNQPLDTPPFGTVTNPIRMMMHEHSNEGERFSKIAELSQGYTPPQDACNTYRVAFALLNEFENDLHLHIHLENNILFPEAILLEESMKK